MEFLFGINIFQPEELRCYIIHGTGLMTPSFSFCLSENFFFFYLHFYNIFVVIHNSGLTLLFHSVFSSYTFNCLLAAFVPVEPVIILVFISIYVVYFMLCSGYVLNFCLIIVSQQFDFERCWSGLLGTCSHFFISDTYIF